MSVACGRTVLYVWVEMPASFQACGVDFPFATATSICRSTVTICSALYFLIDPPDSLYQP